MLQLILLYFYYWYCYNMKLTVPLYFCGSCILIFVYLLWGVCECCISSSVLTVSKVCFRQMGWVRSQGEFRVPKRLMNSWTFSCVNTCVCSEAVQSSSTLKSSRTQRITAAPQRRSTSPRRADQQENQQPPVWGKNRTDPVQGSDWFSLWIFTCEVVEFIFQVVMSSIEAEHMWPKQEVVLDWKGPGEGRRGQYSFNVFKYLYPQQERWAKIFRKYSFSQRETSSVAEFHPTKPETRPTSGPMFAG